MKTLTVKIHKIFFFVNIVELKDRSPLAPKFGLRFSIRAGWRRKRRKELQNVYTKLNWRPERNVAGLRQRLAKNS
jgi:hypothetical protein